MATKVDPSDKTSSLTSTLLVLTIILNILSIYLLMGNSVSLPSSISVDALGVKRAFLEIEYAKVGGKENYDIMTAAQQLSVNDPQNPSNIKAMKQYVDSFASGGSQLPGQGAEGTPSIGATMDAAEIAKVISGAVLEGNKSADIVAIEYSDMECPFCIKQYQETKLQSALLAQYGDKVAFAFKNSRWVNHPGTEAKALGALCAKKVGGDVAYAQFYHAIMDGTTQGNVYPVSKLVDIAKNIKIDQAKWQSCVDSKATLAQFDAETAEAQKLGLNGTPGTLLLNVKTGKYMTVEGAYPLSAFTEKISSIQ